MIFHKLKQIQVKRLALWMTLQFSVAIGGPAYAINVPPPAPNWDEMGVQLLNPFSNRYESFAKQSSINYLNNINNHQENQIKILYQKIDVGDGQLRSDLVLVRRELLQNIESGIASLNKDFIARMSGRDVHYSQQMQKSLNKLFSIPEDVREYSVEQANLVKLIAKIVAEQQRLK